MSAKKAKPSADSRAAKRAAVLGSQKKSRLPLVVCLILVVLAPIGAYIILNGSSPALIASQPADTAAPPLESTAAADQVAFPVALFDDGKAHYFEHAGDEATTIRYFILKSSDGVIRAAFDACDVCWPAGKGYAQEGDVMVCRNCGRRFASVRINEIKGGCNPAPLRRSIEGDRLVLRVTDILEGAPYFNFKGKA